MCYYLVWFFSDVEFEVFYCVYEVVFGDECLCEVEVEEFVVGLLCDEWGEGFGVFYYGKIGERNF